MKFASRISKVSKDGELCLISKDLKWGVSLGHLCTNLREALEDWNKYSEPFEKIYQELNLKKSKDMFAVREEDFLSALPRTWLFVDGSSFVHHIKLVRMARKAPLPETLMTVPLVYQGESGRFLSPKEEIPQVSFKHGTDFEGEVGVITDFVPMGSTPEQAAKKIRLVVLINDVSLRGLIPEELAQGFGFFVSKPASALSPFAVTPDELGEHWRDCKVHLPLEVKYNGEFFGRANAGAMQFNFAQLISHAAQTRDLAAGSLVGSGTVSNEDPSVGSSCLAEKRMIEQIQSGEAKTPFMKIGDSVSMEMRLPNGESIFGKIEQKVAEAKLK